MNDRLIAIEANIMGIQKDTTCGPDLFSLFSQFLPSEAMFLCIRLGVSD